MPATFAEKLALVLKVMSLSRAHLAAEIGVDKSVVARWASGTASPSAHNLAKLSTVMARKVSGFTALDWDRDSEAFAGLLGVGPKPAPTAVESGLRPGLVLPFMDQIMAATALRAPAYEGFYRTTRPYPGYPGQFIHDICLVRRGEDGLIRLRMAAGGVFVDGWVLPLQNQLFIIASEFTSGSLIFTILNGVNTVEAEVLDGITLLPSLDVGRTPTAGRIVLQRIGELSDDPSADEARFRQLGEANPIAPEGSVPDALRDHLTRGIDADRAHEVSDWVLRLPLTISLSRGAPPKLPG